jgi:adenylosuccinate lyase
MKQVWSDENKFTKWLDVEIAVCEPGLKSGKYPKCRSKIKMARLNMKRMEKFLQETHHDMTAFIRSSQRAWGLKPGLFHLGMTSSDVMDTALSNATGRSPPYSQ